MSLLARVRRFARRHQLWRPDTRLIAAVSGGSDSVALLVLLHDLHTRGELVLDSVVHLNHQIRGSASDEDETFCRAVAERLGVDFECSRVDVPALAGRQRLSLEVAARQARREVFEEVRRARGADAVATGHTQDDQAETVLMRVVRGAGLRGLGGIAPAAEGRIRPLLECTREELRAELRLRQQPWREDATNADVANPRNRIRHELLPYLEQHFNPSARRALGRLAALVRDDAAALDAQARDAVTGVLEFEGGKAYLSPTGLAALPPAVAGRVILQALEAVAAAAYTFDDMEMVSSVVRGETGGCDVGVLRVEHSGGSVVLMKRTACPPQPPAFSAELPVPGTVQIPEAGWVVEATGPRPPQPGGMRPASNHVVEIEADGLGSGFIVRSRQPGDRLRPLGLGGEKKLQDVLVDRKVARAERDCVPIVTDRRGRIVWVAGHVLGEEFRVTDRTTAVIILKLRRL